MDPENICKKLVEEEGAIVILIDKFEQEQKTSTGLIIPKREPVQLEFDFGVDL